MMDNPELLLLYSVKDEELKTFLFSQFGNDGLEDINISCKALENFYWPLSPEEQNQFKKVPVIIVIYSQASIDFFKDCAERFSSLEKLLNPNNTISVLHEINFVDLKSLLTFNFSYENCYHFQLDEAEDVIRTAEALLKQDKYTKKKHKASFKLVPRKVYEGKGRVHIILEQPLNQDQQLKVFTNTSVVLTDINVKKVNPYCWQFDIPDHFLRDAMVLKVGICEDENILETQKVKCECRLSQLYNLLSGCCCPAELMIDALEVNSYAAFDGMLAAAFKKRFPKSELCELYIKELDMGCTKAKQEIPTLIHFAARYGLKQLMEELLQCPGALSACNMKNSLGRTPSKLASDFKHHGLVEFIMEFQKSKNIKEEFKRMPSYDTLPPAPSTPAVSNLPILNTSFETEGDSIDNNNIYDIPPLLPIRVAEYEDIEKATDNNNMSFMPDFSPPPTNESVFLESQTKLLEINEAYKKGASELQVMSMFEKWKSSYNVDSEAKSTLDTLRVLYAERNKTKSSKKSSVSFSEFKHLFKFKFRKKSTDPQDAGDHLNEMRYKYPKSRSNSKKQQSERNSNTFSTTSYISGSSSSSSDRMSFMSENSDYYDYVTSLTNHSDLCEKNTYLMDFAKSSESKQSMESLKYSPSVHVKQDASILRNSKGNGSVKSHNLLCQNSQDQQIHLLLPEEHNGWAATTVNTSRPIQNKCDGYDFLPPRCPIPVNLRNKNGELGKQNYNSAQIKNQDIPSYATDYDVPKPLVLEDLNSIMHERFSSEPIKIKYNQNISSNNENCNSNHSFSYEQTYENISPTTSLSRCDSLPDEIAPLPPTFQEEEEHYKYVGMPVPVGNNI